jgi:hypothetical protein
MPRRERAKTNGDGRGAAPRIGERGQQPVERAVLAEEQDLVLPAEVVIEIAGREIGGDGNLAHPGGRESAAPEHPGGGFQDLQAARLGAT